MSPSGASTRAVLVSLLLAGAISGALARGALTRARGPAAHFDRLYRDIPLPRGERFVTVALPLGLTVGLEEGQTRVPIRATGAMAVRIGDHAVSLPAGSRIVARRVEGTPAQIEYQPVVATFLADQGSRAEEVAAVWRGRGYPAEVVAAGIVLASDVGVISDNRRIYVIVGRITDEAEARRVLQALIAQGARPWLYERVLRLQQGTLALVGPDGQEVARGRSVSVSAPVPITVEDVEFDVGLPGHGRQTRTYRGLIGVVFDKRGMLCCINRVGLEDYLRGVVPSEVPASYPPEAIKAQAVCARSETIAGLGLKYAADPYDICADQRCQAYKGVGAEDPRSSAAVEATAGEVLRVGARVLAAVYSHGCGGHTESAQNVWSTPPDPGLVGVEDSPAPTGFPSPVTEVGLARWLTRRPAAHCESDGGRPAPHFRWSVTLTSARVDELINRRYPVGHVLDLIPVERGVSGRLVLLKAVGTRGEELIYKELPIRQALGGLRSGVFVVRVLRDKSREPRTFTFIGGGWGHGVGMCQVGAQGMARTGAVYRRILGHYFRGARHASIRHGRP